MSHHHKFELPMQELQSLPTSTVKDITNKLGSKIAEGSYEIGRNLPMETSLVEQFGVSRTVVREAIKVLSGKGMVRTARRYGSKVTPFDEWNLLDPDVIGWHGPTSPMAKRIYFEVTELRCIVEPEAAALAAKKATDEQKAILISAANCIDPDSGISDANIAAEFAFHSTILEASGNIMLRQLTGVVLAILKFSLQTGAMKAPAESVSRSGHISVAEAISNGKSKLSRMQMKKMLSQNKSIAEKFLQSSD